LCVITVVFTHLSEKEVLNSLHKFNYLLILPYDYSQIANIFLLKRNKNTGFCILVMILTSFPPVYHNNVVLMLNLQK
jgi:hypothetical protein